MLNQVRSKSYSNSETWLNDTILYLLSRQLLTHLNRLMFCLSATAGKAEVDMDQLQAACASISQQIAQIRKLSSTSSNYRDLIEAVLIAVEEVFKIARHGVEILMVGKTASRKVFFDCVGIWDALKEMNETLILTCSSGAFRVNLPKQLLDTLVTILTLDRQLMQLNAAIDECFKKSGTSGFNEYTEAARQLIEELTKLRELLAKDLELPGKSVYSLLLKCDKKSVRSSWTIDIILEKVNVVTDNVAELLTINTITPRDLKTTKRFQKQFELLNGELEMYLCILRCMILSSLEDCSNHQT